jgi:hypothetical protein
MYKQILGRGLVVCYSFISSICPHVDDMISDRCQALEVHSTSE